VIYAYNIRITYVSVMILSLRSEISCHVILRIEAVISINNITAWNMYFVIVQSHIASPGGRTV